MNRVLFFVSIFNFILFFTSLSFGVDFNSHLLASYEPQEINDLNVTTNPAVDPTLIVTWPVLGGVDGVPLATDGEYVLKMSWTNENDEPNHKVQVGHYWNNTTFDLADVNFIHFDMYVVDESAMPGAGGIGIWDSSWVHPWTGALCEPVRIGEWRDITMVVVGNSASDINHIEALVFDHLQGTSGTVYIDNLRIGPPACTCMRKIKFADYNWSVMQADWAIDVGPNRFTDEHNDVFVDCYGDLHISVVDKDPNWYCSNLIGNANLGYGRYIFTVKGSEKMLDPNIVLGLFIFDVPDSNGHPREIDFELSRWWDHNEPNNAQFVIQPWDNPGNRYRFSLDERRTVTHEISWTPEIIRCRSYYGDFPLKESNDLITSWKYTGDDIPLAGTENPMINLWLLPPFGSPSNTPGVPPSDGQDAHMIIKNFLYLAVPGDLNEDGYVDLPDLALFAENWLVGH